MAFLDQLTSLGFVTLAMLLGGLIGFERETAGKPAGLRTHMLVAGAAALLVSVGSALLGHFLTPGVSDNVRADPTRLVQAIITGISFLGAGTIFRSEDAHRVEGLTTAGSVLFVAAIGICVGARQIVLSVGVTLVALIVLRAVGHLESYLEKRRAMLGKKHGPRDDRSE